MRSPPKALGLLYLLVTPAKYTATATLLIDSSTLRVLQNQLQPQGDVPLDSLQVGSQVEVLASRNLGLAVISALKLDEDREFIGSDWAPPSTPARRRTGKKVRSTSFSAAAQFRGWREPTP